MYTAIVPIKSWDIGKSRLSSEPAVRRALARAFSLDVLAAISGAASVARIVVVTGDPDVADVARDLGAHVAAETDARSDDPLNAAIRSGREWALDRHADDPVVVVLADLPCLRSEPFDEALQRALDHATAFVPDREGTGTAILTARSADRLDPAFGPDSCRRHRDLGAVELQGVAASVRQDVDTIDDLERARQLGLGTHTAAAMPRG